MHFSIITPSFNQLDYLKRCVASVKDQAPVVLRTEDGGRRSEDRGRRTEDGLPDVALAKSGGRRTDNLPKITVHHHVQDGGSADGACEWLKRYAQEIGGRSSEDGTRKTEGYGFSYASEPDKGMYEAINKGVECSLKFGVGGLRFENGGRRAEDRNRGGEGSGPPENAANHKLSTPNSSDSVIAWLNCDEQYLPGTLEKVADFFEDHPGVDVLCGDALVVDGSGNLSGFWKAMPLRLNYVQSGYLYNLSCAIFFRASVFADELRFDPSFRAVGDQEFFIRLLKRKIRSAVIRDYLSVYTFLPGNISEQGFAGAEKAQLHKQLSGGRRLLRPVWRMAQRAERVLRGCRRQQFPLNYQVYTQDGEKRSAFSSEKTPSCWPGVRNKDG